MSHDLRLCDSPSIALSGTTYISVLQNDWSYWNVGEINLLNGGYGNGAFLYSHDSWRHVDLLDDRQCDAGLGIVEQPLGHHHGWIRPDRLRRLGSQRLHVLLRVLVQPGRPFTARPRRPAELAPVRLSGPDSRAGSHRSSNAGSARRSHARADRSPDAGAGRCPDARRGDAERARSGRRPRFAGQHDGRTCGRYGCEFRRRLGGSHRAAHRCADPPVGRSGSNGLSHSRWWPGRCPYHNRGAAPSDGASGLAGTIARIVALVSGSGATVMAGCYLFQAMRRRRRPPRDSHVADGRLPALVP